jgi:hypothetical protein
MGTVKGLLRQHQSRLRPLKLRLPCGYGFNTCSDEHIGKLGLGDSHRCLHLFELGNGLGIVDPYEHGLRRDVLARSTGISLTRPSTRAAMSSRVASASPCTSSGSGRKR